MNPIHSIVLAVFFLFRGDGAVHVEVKTPPSYYDCTISSPIDAEAFQQKNPGVVKVIPLCLTIPEDAEQPAREAP